MRSASVFALIAAFSTIAAVPRARAQDDASSAESPPAAAAAAEREPAATQAAAAPAAPAKPKPRSANQRASQEAGASASAEADLAKTDAAKTDPAKKEGEEPGSAPAPKPLDFNALEELAHPIPTLADGQQGEIVKLTLEESVARAIQAATGVQRARNDRDVTGQQLIQGYAQFLPNLQAIGGYSTMQGRQLLTTAQPTVVEGRSHGATYQISSTLNIFNGLADLSALQSAIARNRSSELALLRAKQLIALDVAQSFLQVVLDRDVVKIAVRNLASSRGRERLLSEQTRVGVRNLSDLYRQQAQTSLDESFLTSSQTKERADSLLLLRKIHFDPARRYEFVEPALEGDSKKAPAYDDEAKLVQAALDARPDLRSQKQISDAYRYETRVARSGFFPRLDLAASAIGGGRQLDSQLVNGADVSNVNAQPIGDQLSGNVVYTIGLTLTWNIFDRWVTRANLERASVAARNSQIDLEDVRNQVVGEARQAYGDYRAALQQLDSSGKGLIAAQKAFDTMNGRYQVGAANFIDLLSAQATLVQAGAARAQALISYALQAKTLDTVTGVAKVD